MRPAWRLFRSLHRFGYLFLLLLFLSVTVACAQLPGKANIGVGAGLDYGGLGMRVTYLPLDSLEIIGVFGSAGYNLGGVGYNFGAQVYLPSQKRATGYLTAMYGYNAVLVVKADTRITNTYYGPSIGAGLTLKGRRHEKNFWNFELLYPIRSQVFFDAIDDLELLGFDVQEPTPVAISVGYHLTIW